MMIGQQNFGVQPAGGAGTARSPSWRCTLGLGLLGSGLMWLPQPPLAWWPLAWIAPIPWLLLVRKRGLTGRWVYTHVHLAGWLFWLLSLHWIRLPHPANTWPGHS